MRHKCFLSWSLCYKCNLIMKAEVIPLKKNALRFNLTIIHLQVAVEHFFCWFTAVVSWGIHLREISWWSTVPRIVPGISEIFELTPTNWNGEGFVSWVSLRHIVYSSTKILAWSRARCEKCSIPDNSDSGHCAHGARVVYQTLCQALVTCSAT